MESHVDNLTYHLLRASLNRYQKTPDELEDAAIQQIRHQASKEYALEKRVLSSDEARRVSVPSSVVDQHLTTISSRYEDTETFEQDLQKNGLDLKSLRAAIEREVRVESTLDLVSSQAAKVSDVEARIFYFMHPEKFVVEETRSVRHILITVNDSYDENHEEVVKERIDQIVKRIRKKPARFSEQALKHSECPTAMQGGLIGRVPQGKLFPELDKALFKMDIGDIRAPLKSELGYHILLCEEIHPEGQIPYKDAREKICEKLQSRRRKQCVASWMRTL